MPTILVDDAVAEHPVVVEQWKSQPEPATQAVEQTWAVRVLHSSSFSPSPPEEPPPPPPDPPPPLIDPPPGGQRRQGPLQKGKQPWPVPLLPLLAEGVGLSDDQVVVRVLRTESLLVWDHGYGGGVIVVVVLVALGPVPWGGST